MDIAPARAPGLIVGIGASAGGLDAFKAFLQSMPVDADIAFVLVQHLAPDHASVLVELLAHATAMPVHEARDGLKVAGGNVYVIPPDATLTIRDGVLGLSRPAPPRSHRWPIDTFFASLAEDQGARAVCIVLAGTGSDGTRGLRLIKDHGGLALAQSDAERVALSGMPESAAITGLVDHVLPIAEMPAKLLAYRRALPNAPAPVGDTETDDQWTGPLAAICALLRSKVGHDFSQYKQNTLVRRVQRRMHVAGIDRLDDYVTQLENDPAEPQNLFRELLIGVTEFFRDPDAFRTLYDEAILPLVQSTDAAGTIRVWVPGCATGEEAYAIAILVKEAMEQAARTPTVQIFATDIDEPALAAARAGRFRGALPGLSPERLARWFRKEGDAYRVNKEIRELCIFSAHSAFRDPPFSRMDLISCRNLLIYLSTELQDRLARLFHYALVRGGFLFLGSSESMARHPDLFLVKSKKARLYVTREVTQAAQRFLAPSMRFGPPPRAVPFESALYPASFEHDLDRRVQRALERHSPAHVVIDAHHEVLRFSGITSPYLEHSTGTASLDVFRLLQRPLRAPARAAIREALESGRTAIRDGLAAVVDTQRRGLRLVVEPLTSADGKAPFFVLAFVLGEPLGDVAKSAHSAPVAHEEESAHALELELDAMRMHLQSSLSQLENAQQEMKSAAEEYQSVNEELQSSNEELETSKEEMQSINEELQTINAELLVKNETLARLNNDLQNLLESTQIATLFLDAQLNVTGFTPALTELFHLRDSDRGRPITEIASRVMYAELGRDVAAVLRTLAVIERIVHSESDGPIFLLRMRPYRTTDNRIEGVVLTFVDITDRERASERARLAAIVESSRDVIIGLGRDLSIVSWNASATALLGYAPAEVLGKPLDILQADGTESPTQRVAAALAQERPTTDFETTWRGKFGDDVAVALLCSPVKDAAQPEIVGSVIARDIGERTRTARRMTLMNDELNHRVKNTLSIVQAIALQTLGDARDVRDFEESFIPRLGMLANTHSLLASVAWGEIDLRRVLESEFAPYQLDGRTRVQTSGDHVRIKPAAALALSMSVHELLTNASKYGALSTPDGFVQVAWRVVARARSRRLRLAWSEHGGPRVAPPTRLGFGSRLITEGLPLELDAEVELDYAPEGVNCTIEFPLAAAIAPP